MAKKKKCSLLPKLGHGYMDVYYTILFTFLYV